jgi:acyl-CoA dehydrogenase
VTFRQPPPGTVDPFAHDPVLQAWLRARLPEEVRRAIEPELREMGALAAGPLAELQAADIGREPVFTPWDAWGERIDRIEHTPLWEAAARIAATHGLVATAYDGGHGRWNRVHQMALAYLFIPVTDLYGCPLAMTDGATRTLLESGDAELIERAVPRLTSRDPGCAWTSGQWMTELTGGSDVGLAETVARPDGEGGWTLHGRKWFASAIDSDMALVLARPEGNPAGGRGLAVFYVETRDENVRMDRIRVDRLKDKLGTRKLPTAEIRLEGTPARLVGEARDGVRRIAPMLDITRTWNAVTASALMRRGIALARDYAERRVAFGAPLAEKPLHLDTLAGLEAESRAAFHLTFHLVELLGEREAGEMDDGRALLLRLLTPVVKLTTARQAVAVLSEVVGCFGGVGYLEDTGIPMLLRDAQVLPIWEGTTNVLSLETLRALRGGSALAALQLEVETLGAGLRDPHLVALHGTATDALIAAERWLGEVRDEAEGDATEAGARRFALTLGRGLALALLCRAAQEEIDHPGDRAMLAAARRFARHGVSSVMPVDPAESRALGRGEPLSD